MNTLCGFVAVLLVTWNLSDAVVDTDTQEARSVMLSVLGSLKDSRNDGGRWNSQSAWDKYRGGQTGSSGGGGGGDEDADLDKAISVLTKAVGDIDKGKTSMRLANKPEITSSVTHLTNNQAIPENVANIIDSAISNSNSKIPEGVADIIRSASSKTNTYTNQDDQSKVARVYNSATSKNNINNQAIPANIADLISSATGGSNSGPPDNFGRNFNAVPSNNVKNYRDVQVSTNIDDGSNVDVGKIIQDAFAKTGDSQTGKWRSYPDVNTNKADGPFVQNYHDVQVSTSNSNPDGSNVDVSKILKDAFAKVGDEQKWQNYQDGTSIQADTPTGQKYPNVKVSTSNSNPDGSNVDVNKILQDALGNAGNGQTWQNFPKGSSYKVDTPSVQNYKDVKVSTSNSNSDGSNVDVDKVIKDALGNTGDVQKWQSLPSGNSIKVDTQPVQNYRDVKVSTSDSDNSNADVGKMLQDVFGKIGNGQQNSWPNFADVKSYKSNNNPPVQVSSSSERRTYTNNGPKQVQKWRSSSTDDKKDDITSGSWWRQKDSGRCLQQGELCKVGIGPACCGSDTAYGSQTPLCCVRAAVGSTRSVYGLCQPKKAGVTCDRR